MANFMLLLYNTPTDFTQLSAEEIQNVVGEYAAWRNGLAAKDQLVGSNKLTFDAGKHLVMNDGQLRVTDGPFTESKEIVGGYFIVSAENYDDAAKISEGCPHLKYGGRIELRQVDAMA